MRMARTMLVVLGALAAATAQAQTSDPQPLPGNPPFAYPKVAQDVGVVGDVSFRVEVDAQGAATGVKVEAVPAHDVGFEEAVEKAVRRWRFRPAVRDGTPVPGVFAATVTFRLHPEDEEKIRRAVAGFAESWNGGRKDALRPLVDPEFTVRVPAHDRMKGNAAIDIVEPRKLRNVAPVYPDSARQARIQDVVILECVIAVDGRVEDVVALRGHALLRDAAVEAVRQWRYTPTLRGGVAVPVIMTVTVAFRLR
jgi:TonB family protein